MCSSRCSLSAEGEVGSPWLQDTGLPGLLGGQGLDGDHQGLLSTLTQTQRAAVRRLDVFTRSTQRRHEAPAGGVRDIFGGFSSTVSEWRKSYCRTCLPGASARPPHPKCDSDSVAGLCWGVCVCVCVCVQWECLPVHLQATMFPLSMQVFSSYGILGKISAPQLLHL